ncbi:AAA family ATPase, partial [Francisella tularensis subsp. holarctica]|uniref:AAA family ATPase n=1 Tax=Francisella tularensis TaxID=263 RepID=UPI002381C30F
DTIRNYYLIIIDEASMINKVLFELIYSEINRSLITKVLFLGDQAQIQPIGEQLSPIYTLENSYQLTQLKLQETDNPLAT